MRSNEFLEQFPPEENSWEGKVTLSLGYPSNGWIQVGITCTAFVQGAIVSFSDAFDPFPDLLQWLEGIAFGELPCEFTFDEEGSEKVFRASPVDDENFLFEILENDWDPNISEQQPVFMYVEASRRQFLSEFLKRWDDFLVNQYDPGEWKGKEDLRDLDVTKIRDFVA